MSRSGSLAVSVGVLAILAGTALADEQCPRGPEWGQPPTFWAPDGAGNPRTQLWARHDGRWVGSAQVGLEGERGRIRLLDGGDALHVDLEIDQVAFDREVFWIGLATGTGTTPVLMRIDVAPDPATGLVPPQHPMRCYCPPAVDGNNCTAGQCPNNALVTYRLFSYKDATPTQAHFEWDRNAQDATVDAKTWLEAAQPGVAWHGGLYTATTGGPVGPAPAGSPTGATAMIRIPKTELPASPTSTYKMFLLGAACATADTCASVGTWPTGIGEVVVSNDNFEFYTPPVADWGDLKLDGSGCAGNADLVAAGIQNDAVYTAGKPFTWPQQIFLDKDGAPANDPPNWFVSRIEAGTNALPAGTFRTRFFIADWGSQIGNLDVAAWTEIGSADNPAMVAGATDDTVARWPTKNSGETDPAYALRMKELACTYSDCTSANPNCPYPSNVTPDPCATAGFTRKHAPHQCLQVRIENLQPYGLDRDSMIINNDFVGASVYWREATITLAGIAGVKPAPDGRDVYIQVRPANLPQRSDETPALATAERYGRIGDAAVDGMPAHVRIPDDRRLSGAIREALGQDGGPDDDLFRRRQLEALRMVRRLPYRRVREIAPTLEFFVYYASDALVEYRGAGNTPVRWLRPMTSFGYVAEHVGKITGWEWALDGAEPLGNNWFRVKVADGGKRKVRTRIQAVEEKRMPAGVPSWPPGSTWVGKRETTNRAATVTVKVRGGGCSAAGGGSGLGAIAILAALGLIARRRR